MTLMLLFTAIAALGQGPWQGDMNAAIAACSEYTWLTKHKRVDGTMYSCTSLGVTLGGGLGPAITGWLLAASHFDSALAVQPESCISIRKEAICQANVLTVRVHFATAAMVAGNYV